jgi:hypothetical protein
LNISDGAQIMDVGTYAISNEIYSLTLSNKIAYVGDTSGYLWALDVSDPQNIILLGTYLSAYPVRGVQVLENTAYLANIVGLQLVDLTHYQLTGKLQVSLLGRQYPIRVWAWRAGKPQVYNDFQLALARLPRPIDSALIDQSVFPGQTLSLALDVNLLFTNLLSGLMTLTMQTLPLTTSAPLMSATLKLSPQLLGQYITSEPAFSVDIQNHIAYVAAAASGIWVLDVSTPSEMVLLSHYNAVPGDHSANFIKIVDDVAYVAWGLAGLQVLNISNPRQLASLGRYITTDSAFLLDVSGDRVYMALSNLDLTGGELLILGISDRADITPLGRYSLSSAAWSVQVFNALAFISNDLAGLMVQCNRS